MKSITIQDSAAVSRLKLFLALSRTPHGLLDMATPALGAVLWLGAFPSAEIVALGLLTAFSGYTAIYALNDVKDYRVDQEKIRTSPNLLSRQDVDSVFIRHPLARGVLGYGQGFFWMAAWAALAIAGAFLLNPFCILIFLFACLLEIVYCSLLKITHFRGIISGMVKTSGPIAAVFAVDPAPNFSFLLILFLWLFSWEIGGQNIPNDWADLEEDRRIHAKTIPVCFGLQTSLWVILFSLTVSIAMSVVMFWVSPKPPGYFYLAAAISAGIYFLLYPVYRLYKNNLPENAFFLFNRSSYYPLAMFLAFIITWFVKG